MRAFGIGKVAIDVGVAATLLTACGSEESAERLVEESSEPEITNMERHEDSSVAAGELGSGDRAVRLLKPEELKAKVRQVFGKEWLVTNPKNGRIQPGFEVFAANLNGIDYDTIDAYPDDVSSMYLSTQERFCRELSDDTVMQPDSLAPFSEGAFSDGSVLASAFRDVFRHMFGIEVATEDTLITMAIGLYRDLYEMSPSDRGYGHPFKFTIYSLCFSGVFVHSL